MGGTAVFDACHIGLPKFLNSFACKSNHKGHTRDCTVCVPVRKSLCSAVGQYLTDDNPVNVKAHDSTFIRSGNNSSALGVFWQ